IVIRQSESRDGSGWPTDDEDLDSERPSSGHHSSILFNCSYRKAEDAPTHFRLDFQHEPVENVTFSMELYNTSLFRHPQPSSFFQVMENKPIFVE
ncbi:transforming growth factor beta receptor type 3, partial [Tachysurus ichikawai]